MAQHILNQHNDVRFETLRLWPERGLIHIEDGRDWELLRLRCPYARCCCV